MPKKKSNWDIIRNQKSTDTTKYRDVYEDQQLERGSIAEKQTMTGRLILAGAFSLLLALMVWFIVSAVQMFTNKAGLDDDANPADDWVHVTEYYYDVNDMNKVLSVEEYDKWYKTYHDYDSQRSPSDEPPEIPVDDLSAFASSFFYNAENNMYSKDGVEYSPAEYQQMVFDHGTEYKAKIDEYNLYYYRHTDPEYRDGDESCGAYKKSVAHYKNINNFSNVISEDAYATMISDYEKNISQIPEDTASIPLMPINMQALYEARDYRYITYDDYWKEQGLINSDLASAVSKESFDEFITWCSENAYDITNSPYTLNVINAPDASNTDLVQQYARYQAFWNKLKDVFGSVSPSSSYKDCWETFDAYCEAVHYNRQSRTYYIGSMVIYMPQAYRNKLDGTVLSVAEYKEIGNKYSQDMEVYQTEYLKHREEYHPDDIDGTKAVFTMRPNLVKVIISLFLSGILFGVLVTIFKKNLTAQNLMADTADINQYSDDQHIALPEEVQKNYDWFPDVGAHSSVQVSSMISHMAISNKGLKTVVMAKRAKDDIKDSDGSIKYYKGAVLLDDDGNPVTYNAPIIDIDFMEALYDASGAPKDKKIRHYYDPTKISYNPGNENRDKLQGKKKDSKGEVIKGKDGKPISTYNTVADLINLDWEFPLYEPQRPGGAYIVDTAPVNTMV